MKTEDIEQLMEWTPEGVDWSTRKILDSDADEYQFDYFYDQVVTIIFHWMGRGEVATLDEWLGVVHGINCEDHALIQRLRELGHIVVLYLRTDNLLKGMVKASTFSPEDRATLLGWYAWNKPKGEALESLRRTGFLGDTVFSDSVEGDDISWIGRQVCREILRRQ